MLKSFPRSARRRWSGVSSSGTPPSIPAIFPISVSMPVAMTTPRPRPLTTLVDMKAMCFLSPREVRSPAEKV